jgi:DNA-binding Lrp family transcriptional regulator
MNNLSKKQHEVASLIQKDIPIVNTPFEEAGRSCGLSGEEFLGIIKDLSEKGFIRKFTTILRHQKAGYKENAMIVWSVPARQTQKAGETFASFSFISHCYERKPAFQGKYNIFTMLHSPKDNIASLIKKMVNASQIEDYLILKSVKEYKKSSPEYF